VVNGLDYADFLRVGYMKNKLKMIYCVAKSFNKAYRRTFEMIPQSNSGRMLEHDH